MDKIIISLDDLSDRQREIAEVIGIENYIKLSKRFGGEDSVYIQKYSEIIKSMRSSYSRCCRSRRTRRPTSLSSQIIERYGM